ncbi:MAG: ABC transporter ATP-binding protein [Bacillota bacterium]
MLVVNGLTKKYGKLVANDHLSFEAPAGQITVLLGANGAGKSTAIKAIAGLLRYEGSITIGAHDNKSTEAKHLLGYVPEAPSVYDLLSVQEHMEFIARAYSLKDGWKERSEMLLERFELADKGKKMGKELSKGMQQKVSICCALLHSPTMLLVDEPMVGLDPHAIKQLKATLAEERAHGVAVLISTHLIDSVEELWDRALILVEGKIAAVRTREELARNSETLEELFFSITEGASTADKDGALA